MKAELCFTFEVAAPGSHLERSLPKKKINNKDSLNSSINEISSYNLNGKLPPPPPPQTEIH